MKTKKPDKKKHPSGHAGRKRRRERLAKQYGVAGVYGSTTHYLKAVKAAGTTDSTAVMAEMRKIPINDFMTKNGTIRADGRVLRDFYLFEVKKPSESKADWDYYKLVQTVPAEEAARPLSESQCPLITGSAAPAK